LAYIWQNFPIIGKVRCKSQVTPVAPTDYD